MKKNIIILALFSIFMMILSLLIIKIDLNYYPYNNLKENFSLVIISESLINNCDGICQQYRGFPFPMRLSPAIHEHMNVLWYSREVLLNFLFYFFIGGFLLYVVSIYGKVAKK